MRIRQRGLVTAFALLASAVWIEAPSRADDSVRTGFLALATGANLSRLNDSELLAVLALLRGGFARQIPTANERKAVNVGLLTCRLAKTSGLVLDSAPATKCEYSEKYSGTDRYSAVLTRFACEINDLKTSLAAWMVLAPTISVAPGGLAGDYSGTAAEAGANALVGGPNGRFMLQPVSIAGPASSDAVKSIAALMLRTPQ